MARELQVVCPAGREAFPPGDGFSVICGVIERENRDESGPQVRALVTSREEPTTLAAYCCEALPGTRRGYVNCPVWRSEVARRDRGARRIDAGDANYGGVRNRL